jgi:hypothetical protein
MKKNIFYSMNEHAAKSFGADAKARASRPQTFKLA